MLSSSRDVDLRRAGHRQVRHGRRHGRQLGGDEAVALERHRQRRGVGALGRRDQRDAARDRSPRPITSPPCLSVAMRPVGARLVDVTRTWKDGSPTGNEPVRCWNRVVNAVGVERRRRRRVRISMLRVAEQVPDQVLAVTWPVSCWVGPCLRRHVRLARVQDLAQPRERLRRAERRHRLREHRVGPADGQLVVLHGRADVGVADRPRRRRRPGAAAAARRSSGCPGNWKPALEQLIDRTTGSSVLFEFSSPTSLMLMPGLAQLSRLPWSRWTNRKRPAFSSLTTWSRPSVQGVAGRLSSSGIGVLSLNDLDVGRGLSGVQPGHDVAARAQPGAHLLGRQREAARVARAEALEVRGHRRVVVEVVARRRGQLGLVVDDLVDRRLRDGQRVRRDAAQHHVGERVGADAVERVGQVGRHRAGRRVVAPRLLERRHVRRVAEQHDVRRAACSCRRSARRG